MQQKRKFLLPAVLILVVLLGLAAAFLIRNANTLIKERLEAMVGKGLAVKELSLNWGSVRAEGISFVAGGETIAEAESLILKADFWAALTKKLAVSSLELERPVLRFSLDREGKIINPVAGGGKKASSPSSVPSFEIREVVVRDGTVIVRDGRLSEGRNTTTARGVNLHVTGFAYPFGDAFTKVELSADLEGFLASGKIACSGDINLGTRAMKMNIQGAKLSLLSREEGAVAKADELRAFILSEGRDKGYSIPEAVLEGPSLELETDRQGKLISPSPFPKENNDGEKRTASPVTIKNLTVKRGRLLYLDGKVSKPPQPTEIDALEMTMTDISFPFADGWTGYTLTARIPKKESTGQLSWKGKTNFFSLDTEADLELKGLDITGFKPYFQKKTDADVSRGVLDLSMKMNIRDRTLSAPGRAVIRELDFTGGKSLGDKFIGVPRSMVLSLLKSGDNRIALDFMVEGDLSDPQFNIRESFTRRLTVGLAQRLGLSVVNVGESVVDLGSKGVGAVKEGLKGVGEGLKKLFGK